MSDFKTSEVIWTCRRCKEKVGSAGSAAKHQKAYEEKGDVTHCIFDLAARPPGIVGEGVGA